MTPGKVVWKLSDDGKVLTIYKVNSESRQLDVVVELRRSTPMTEADAHKYANSNYPDSGSVKAAADTLGLLRNK